MKRTVEKTTAYRTSDGLGWDTWDEADRHQGLLDLGEDMPEDDLYIYRQLQITSPLELRDFLSRHQDNILRMMGWQERDDGLDRSKARVVMQRLVDQTNTKMWVDGVECHFEPGAKVEMYVMDPEG